MNEALKQKLKELPVAPGVYFHKNVFGDVIYVGKASVLKNRVRQYFQNSPKDPKTTALVNEIYDTDWIVVDTEMDALFLESEMIKRYMPKWNILLRDDKTVSYIRVNINDEIPYISFTRTPMDDKALYIGPFYGKSAIEKALRILRKIFPYYDRPYSSKKTLYTDLGLTPGIEIGKTTPKEYKANLHKLIRVLQGGKKSLVRELEKVMQESAAKGEYEKAAEARDQLRGLNELKKKIVFADKEFLDISSDQALLKLQEIFHLEKPPRRIEGYDISHQSGTNVVGSMVVFINGTAARDQYRKFKIKEDKNNDFANMREVLIRRLRHKEWDYPDLFLIDGGEPQLEAVKDVLDATGIPYFGLAKEYEEIVVPSRLLAPGLSRPSSRGSSPNSRQQPPKCANNYSVLRFPLSSHVTKLCQRIRDEAHRFAITYHSLLKRKNMLK